MKLKQKYKELKSKYNLPDYDSLNHDFDIEEINDESELILTKIRIKMYEKIDIYKEIIEDLVQPDTSLNSMFEAKNFTDKEREVAYLLFKKLMQLSGDDLARCLFDNLASSVVEVPMTNDAVLRGVNCKEDLLQSTA